MTVAEVAVAEVAVADDAVADDADDADSEVADAKYLQLAKSVAVQCSRRLRRCQSLMALSKLDGSRRRRRRERFDGIVKFVRCDCFLMLGRKPTFHAERESRLTEDFYAE